MKRVAACLLAGIVGASADESSTKVAPPPSYTFMEVGVTDGTDGHRMDDKFFIGRLPVDGESVEMIYVGRDPTSNHLRFQLRVKRPWWRVW